MGLIGKKTIIYVIANLEFTSISLRVLNKNVFEWNRRVDWITYECMCCIMFRLTLTEPYIDCCVLCFSSYRTRFISFINLKFLIYRFFSALFWMSKSLFVMFHGQVRYRSVAKNYQCRNVRICGMISNVQAIR